MDQTNYKDDLPEERDHSEYYCTECGETFEYSEDMHRYNEIREGMCKDCEPCPLCGSPVVDGKCEDVGGHFCGYTR